MHRMPELFSGEKSLTATSEDREGKTKKSQAGGRCRYGHRRTSTADASSQLFVAGRRSLHRACKNNGGRRGASASVAVLHAAMAEAAPSQSLAADRRSLHRACKKISNRRDVPSSTAVLHSARAEATSSQSLAEDRRSLHGACKKVGGRRGASSSAAALHAAEGSHTAVKSTSVLSGQPFAGVSTGDGSKQKSRPETREPALRQVASAIASSGAGCADSIRQAPGPSGLPARLPAVLPQQLLAEGYQLVNVMPFAQGSVQSVYSLRKAVNDSETLKFVVKFPAEWKRCRALKGVIIQENLASQEGGDKYFVPVVKKIMKNGELICHVEPEGTPVDVFLNTTRLDLRQKLHMFLHVLEGVGVMHAHKVANLDIKLNNIVMKNPVTAMKARLCDFDLSITLDNIDEPDIVPIGTYENMCYPVLVKESYPPVMADLWATILTLWKLMAFTRPSLHWLSGVLKNMEKRGRILPVLIDRLSWPEGDHVPEWRSLSDDESMMFDHDLIDRLRRDNNEENRQNLQLFFWENFEFPADIDNMKFSAAEKCILKEMISIMLSVSAYDDKFRRMMSFITAASGCIGQLAEPCGYDEAAILRMIRQAGYQSCGRVESLTQAIQLHSPGQSSDRHGAEMPEVLAHPGDRQNQQINDFMVRKSPLIQLALVAQNARWDDLKDILTDYLARGESLNSLEEKDDAQLVIWLALEWRNRYNLSGNDSRLRLAC